MYSQLELCQLVSELSKTKPDLKLVKSMCQKTGFKYSPDLIELMSDILMNVKSTKKNNEQSQKLNNRTLKNEA